MTAGPQPLTLNAAEWQKLLTTCRPVLQHLFDREDEMNLQPALRVNNPPENHYPVFYAHLHIDGKRGLRTGPFYSGKRCLKACQAKITRIELYSEQTATATYTQRLSALPSRGHLLRATVQYLESTTEALSTAPHVHRMYTTILDTLGMARDPESQQASEFAVETCSGVKDSARPTQFDHLLSKLV